MKDKKKYNKKYTTKDRVDMSKGGRVKAQVGGLKRRPVDIEDRPMSIEREEEIRPTVQPAVAPKDVAPITGTKPVQPTSTFTQAPTTGKGSDQMFIGRTDQETREVQPTSRGSGIGGMLRGTIDKTKAKAEQAAQAQITNRRKQLEDLGYDEEDIRDILERDEIRARERGRDRDERARKQAQAQSRQASTTPMSQADFFKQYGKFEGNVRQKNAYKNWQNKRQKDYENYINSFVNSIGGGAGEGQATIDGKPLITGTPEQLEAERGKRVIQTGRTAEQIATGEIPEGIVPTAELQKVMERRPDETEEAYQARLAETQAEAIQIDPITGVKAIPVEAAPSQVVETMEAATIQTPEELQAAKVQAEQVAKTPEVDLAAGEVVEDALAKAAKVDRVAPIEGAEVEIPEGALAERVVGTISEGAKATAALNVGTSLSRITRAKKQLSRAGLSDADIEEIGNDPEALEDRLADFSEEQRGIIEGLPQEALVSTQMNNLLEGIESGEIPTWARPAVAQVEQMLARRGMSASTVGRDSLFNAIIQSAMPIAQSNAQAIQQSVSQQKTIEAQTAEANAQRMQQTALTNAQNVFQMDMAQFSADQQTALSNSKFLQTVGLTEASNEQQATIQNAVLMSQANLAEADFYQKAQINNANAFLKMDMQNLANEQQVNIVKAQQEQQRMLSNQAATNAARQFNAASENQTQQFMASLEAQVNQFNVAQMNAATQFNVQSRNVAAAREADRIADVNKTNASILNQVNQFNAQLDYNRQQWNAANEQAVLNSNVNWRRQSNLADTAAQNAINQQNAQNAFGLTSSAQSFLWQELRDQADYDFRAGENAANRKLQAMIAAASSEGDAAKYWSTNFNNASSTINRIFGTG
jgi:hypothetical protein